MIQRPEDVGLRPYAREGLGPGTSGDLKSMVVEPERSFTRGEACRTRTFWVLIVFLFFIYPVQAGVSLHQAPHLIGRGISLAVAATAVGGFSLMAAIGGLIFGQLEARFGVRVSANGNWDGHHARGLRYLDRVSVRNRIRCWDWRLTDSFTGGLGE